MYVNSATNASFASTSQATSSGPGVDYQAFLKLLVAEMKNQDPTKPMDATQYVAQLAAFSQVEQSVQINSKLEHMIRTNSVSQTDALLGREITSADGKTTGVVKEVRLAADGVFAILQDGTEVPVIPGVTIREPSGSAGIPGDNQFPVEPGDRNNEAA